MLKTEKSKPDKSYSLENTEFNTMTFPPKQIINLRNHSYGYLKRSPSKYYFNLSDPNLQLVEAPLLAPKEYEIDPEDIKKMEEELQTAQNVAIDDNDDDLN